MIPILSAILPIINKVIPNSDAQAEIQKALIEKELEIEKAFQEYARMDHDLRIKEIEHKGFKASWRPYLMFTFGTLVALYVLLYNILPGVLSLFNLEPSLLLLDPPPVDPALWDLVKYSILGIGGMRSVDKWRKT